MLRTVVDWLLGAALPQMRKCWKLALMPFFSSFQIGFTSAPGQGGILAQREFDRRFSPHFVSFTVFSLGIPLGGEHPFWFWALLASLEDRSS